MYQTFLKELIICPTVFLRDRPLQSHEGLQLHKYSFDLKGISFQIELIDASLPLPNQEPFKSYIHRFNSFIILLVFQTFRDLSSWGVTRRKKEG